MRFFKILERIDRFAYKLKLLLNIKIHDIIFVTYLKIVTDFVEDFYRRYRLLIFVIVVKGEKKYEVEKLFRKRSIRRGCD